MYCCSLHAYYTAQLSLTILTRTFAEVVVWNALFWQLLYINGICCLRKTTAVIHDKLKKQEGGLVNMQLCHVMFCGLHQKLSEARCKQDWLTQLLERRWTQDLVVFCGSKLQYL